MRAWKATAAYTLVQCAMWSFYAVLLGFSSSFLYHHGFSDGQISLLLGLSTVASCLAQPLLAEAVSRLPGLTVYRSLLGLGLVMVLSCLAMANPWWSPPAVAGLALGCATLQTIPAMGNSLAVQSMEAGSPTNFNIARGTGSAAFALCSFAVGQLIAGWGVGVLAPLGLSVAALFYLGLLAYHRWGELSPPAPTGPRQKQKGGFLRANGNYALFLLGATLLLMSHSLLTNFMLQIISAKGGSEAHQGVAVAIAALVELPVMYGFALLLRRLRCESWLQIAAVFFVIKTLGLYLASSPLGVYAAQFTQISGYAVYTIAAVHYARLAVPREESVRAQSYLTTAMALGSMAAAFTGGTLCQYLGVQSMLLAACGIASLGALIVCGATQRQKSRRQPGLGSP